jgi:hypothetical protein
VKRAFGSWMTTARFQGRSRPDPQAEGFHHREVSRRSVSDAGP